MRSAPKIDVRPEAADLFGEADRVGAAVPALHALQDQVVAVLQRQMEVGHQPRLVGDGVH